MSYNASVNNAFDTNKWDRNDYLGDCDNTKYSDPVLANLNLNTVNVIATRSSASASELLTFISRYFASRNPAIRINGRMTSEGHSRSLLIFLNVAKSFPGR